MSALLTFARQHGFTAAPDPECGGIRIHIDVLDRSTGETFTRCLLACDMAQARKIVGY